MNQLNVLSSITQQYVNDNISHQVKILMNGGKHYSGKFIKNNQLAINSARNKWVMTIDYVDIMIDGNNINAFFPFKHRLKPNTQTNP